MKSAASMRQRNVQSADSPKKTERKVSWHEDVMDKPSRGTRPRSPTLSSSGDDHYLTWPFLLLYLLLLGALSAATLHFVWQLPEPVRSARDAASPNHFQSWRARGHLEDLTALGIRHVGNEANEIHAKNLILEKLESIRQSASDDVEIEISVQHPSGSFFLDFLGGVTHIYQNITNIVVRVSGKGSDRDHAFLVNAHYDSALGTVAASDDAVSCGIMLEAVRCLSSEPEPPLASARHAVIFLFNGAEETLLQASHGFVMQHPWMGTVRAFLNLEAAGAGGKEIVFQTGPDHPWLARLYSEAVPYPHASIVAQEVFQSGVIPSDTDFRIFRDFGHIPGIDTAYFINGYVYHTE